VKEEILTCPKCGHVLIRCTGDPEIFMSGAIKISCLKCEKKKRVELKDTDLRGKSATDSR